MITYLAWLLIGSSVFMATFYLNVHRNGNSEESYSLEEYPEVAILMPAYNEEGVVEESLENATNLDYPDYQVVFINDASTDDTLEIAEKFEERDNLTILDHEENKGKAAAMNTGLEEIEADYTVVQDADTSITADLLKEATAKMEHENNLGAVIASIMPLKRDTFVRKLQVVEYRMTNFYRSLMSKIDTLDVTPGAFSIYRTKDLKDLGGFDRGNLTEDLEMAWRLRREKHRSIDMIYGKKSKTEFPATLGDLFNQRVRWSRGFIYNARKHWEMFFNSEYGWFGKFQLPIQGIVPLFAVGGLIMIFIGILEALFNFAVTVSAVGLQFPTLGSMNLARVFLGISWKIYAPLLISLVFTGYLIKTAYSKSGRSVKHPGGMAVYFFAYFAVQASFWTAAILKELFQTKRIWT